jgi:hypothetical protein
VGLRWTGRRKLTKTKKKKKKKNWETKKVQRDMASM